MLKVISPVLARIGGISVQLDVGDEVPEGAEVRPECVEEVGAKKAAARKAPAKKGA